MKTYAVNEIFYSVQGEGIRKGTANVFVRFAGCNQTCKVETHGFDCDTEFVSSKKMTAEEIAQACRAAIAKAGGDHNFATLGGAWAWIILTGGEPGLQVDYALCQYLRAAKFHLAIETNGSIDLSGLPLDWITVSPKVAEHAIRQKTASEVKYVRGAGQGIPKPACESQYKLLSPAFLGNVIDRDALATCIELVLANPEWRLSVQEHKGINVR